MKLLTPEEVEEQTPQELREVLKKQGFEPSCYCHAGVIGWIHPETGVQVDLNYRSEPGMLFLVMYHTNPGMRGITEIRITLVRSEAIPGALEIFRGLPVRDQRFATNAGKDNTQM